MANRGGVTGVSDDYGDCGGDYDKRYNKMGQMLVHEYDL